MTSQRFLIAIVADLTFLAFLLSASEDRHSALSSTEFIHALKRVAIIYPPQNLMMVLMKLMKLMN